MPSKLKSETARLNGAKSRGPKTAEGLDKSSRNALKHGFTSSSAIILACENPEEFKRILDNFVSIFQPATLAETDLVEEMAVARWRIRRLGGVETSLLDAEIRVQEAKSQTGDAAAHLALAFRALADESRALHLASRYEARLHRIYDRAYQTLRDLQLSRKPPEPQAPEPVSSSSTGALPNEPSSVVIEELTTHNEAAPRPAQPPYSTSDTVNESSNESSPRPANETLL